MKSVAILICLLTLSPCGWCGKRYRAAQETSPSASGAQEKVASTQLKGILLQVFLASSRVHDLLTLAEPAGWNMTAADADSFNQRKSAITGELQTLEKWRYEFLYHPGDAVSAKKMLAAMSALLPQIQQIEKTVSQHEGVAKAAPYADAEAGWSHLTDRVESYLQSAFPATFAAQRPPAPRTPSVAAAPAIPPARPSAVSPAEAPSLPAPVAPFPPSHAKSLLMSVYLAEARIKDLLSVAQPANWKMTDAERTVFGEQLLSLTSGLAALEQWRYQFYYHPENAEFGKKTVESLTSLVPHVRDVATAIGEFQSSQAEAQFDPPRKELADLAGSIRSYVDYLRASYQRNLSAQPAGPPGSSPLATEHITTPGLPPPVTSMITLAPPLTQAQVKQILYQAYISLFRIRDLLTQDQPEQWKAPPAGRTAGSLARATLLARISSLEKWRSLFAEHPDNMYDAFETFHFVEDLFQPLDAFSRSVRRYESPKLAADYDRRQADLQSNLTALLPYVGFILEHASRNLGLYQADLASCQNQLTYAMHSSIHAATPMKNIVPDFQGRRPNARDAKRRREKERRREHSREKTTE